MGGGGFFPWRGGLFGGSEVLGRGRQGVRYSELPGRSRRIRVLRCGRWKVSPVEMTRPKVFGGVDSLYIL